MNNFHERSVFAMEFSNEEINLLKGVLLVEVNDLKELIDLPSQNINDRKELMNTLAVAEGLLEKFNKF